MSSSCSQETPLKLLGQSVDRTTKSPYGVIHGGGSDRMCTSRFSIDRRREIFMLLLDRLRPHVDQPTENGYLLVTVAKPIVCCLLEVSSAWKLKVLLKFAINTSALSNLCLVSRDIAFTRRITSHSDPRSYARSYHRTCDLTCYERLKRAAAVFGSSSNLLIRASAPEC